MTEPHERAVSTTLGYVLSLGIVTLLLTGVLFASADFVSDQREQTVRNELRVLGQGIADDLSAADRLVRAGEAGTVVTVTRDLPETVTGSGYTVAVDPGGGPPTAITLATTDPAVTVEVLVRVETDVSASSVTGGRIEVAYTGSALAVRDG